MANFLLAENSNKALEQSQLSICISQPIIRWQKVWKLLIGNLYHLSVENPIVHVFEIGGRHEWVKLGATFGIIGNSMPILLFFNSLYVYAHTKFVGQN